LARFEKFLNVHAKTNWRDEMNDNFLKEEKPIDEGISTATLAGIEERPSLKRDKALDSSERELEEARFDRAEIERPNNNRDAEPARGELRTMPKPNGNLSTPSASAKPNGSPTEESSAPLFPNTEATELRGRWDAIQVGFVDEPRKAVEQADALVAGAMKRMAEIFAEERGRLEGQWDRGDSVSTEDLRLALRRYRSFFGRVLSV
jgi:hypothetical protein